MLDLGTGAGGLLLALLAELPQALGIGVDVRLARSPRPTTTRTTSSRQTGQFRGRRLGDRIVDHSIWLSQIRPISVPSRSDRLSIEVRRYDPRLALDGGQDGLAAYRKFCQTCHGC